MRRRALAAALAALIGVGGWQAVQALQVETGADAGPEQGETVNRPVTNRPDIPAPRNGSPQAPPLVKAATPMAQRVATLGLLNKRNGIARDIVLRPGQAVRVGDVIVRLRACETTAPWENEQLTGAFVQTDLRGRDARWRRVFSGWLYKETPSLNVLENALYDVWPKSCVMKHPEIGPDTVSAGASGARPRRSSAKKSPDAVAAPVPTPSAESSSPT